MVTAMDLDKIIEELRNLENVNTSFNYGVELLVMGLKRDYGLIYDKDDLGYCTSNIERRFGVVFREDKVCRNGFDVACKRMFELVG